MTSCKYFNFLLILLFVSEIYSQSYLPEREFENIEFNCKHEWYKADFVEQMVSDTCDGYNRIGSYSNPIFLVDNDYIYSGMEVHYYDLLYAGFLITKRQIYSGDLIWQYYIDLDSVDRQEVVVNIYKNNDDELFVTTLRRLAHPLIKDPTTFTFGTSDKMNLVRRKIRTSDGSIKTIENTPTDSLSFLSYSNYLSPVSNTEVLYHSDTSIVVRKYENNSLSNGYNFKLEQINFDFKNNIKKIEGKIEISNLVPRFDIIKGENLDFGVMVCIRRTTLLLRL